MAKQNRKNFMLQGAVLAVSSILVRIIGIIYRVPLNNILGEKGVAYYSIAFDVYSLLLLLSSYSLPLAVSKMVSARMAVKQYRNTKRVFLFALGFSLLLGITAFCIVFFGADVFARLESYPQAAIAIRVLAPNLIVLSVLGVMRGFFQGMGNMVPTAFSNIIEQIINAAVSIIAASALFNSAATVAAGTYEFSNVAEALGAAGGTVGTVAGAVAALAFLIFLFVLYKPTQDRLIRKDTSRYAEPAGAILKTLVLTIIPVILSTTIYNINSLLDIAVFGNIMNTKDIARDAVDVMTGMFSGNYRLIVNVPIALANALSASLIPSIVKSVAQKSRRMVVVKVEAAIKVTMLVAFPCAVGIGVLAKP
ncbi:MAG: oligosaccharide flippase family protein, partial [Parasporobacterium sp.]|nr:oligosaccharide flippase family protein [Parasporobacterium sp.]